MRWALGLILLALGCDGLTESVPRLGDLRPPAGGAGGKRAPSSAGGESYGGAPVLETGGTSTGGTSSFEPEPEADWCAVAQLQGASFCSADKQSRIIEYCVPAPVSGGAAGAEGMPGAAGANAGAAGADAGAAGAGAGAAGADAGAAGADAGAAGAAAQVAECPQYDGPPGWAYNLLLQCVAHCGVGIVASARELEGSCCYFARSEYYGR